MASFLERNRPTTEINLTPLVDMMFTLLLMVFVTAPLMTQGMNVELPQTKAVQSLPTEKDHLILSVEKDGTISLDKSPVPIENLANMIDKLVVQQHKQLFMKADKDVPYGIVVKVMGEAKAAGVDKLNVIAEPDAPAAPQGKKSKK